MTKHVNINENTGQILSNTLQELQSCEQQDGLCTVFDNVQIWPAL